MKNFFSMTIKLTLLISWIQLIACSQGEEERVSTDNRVQNRVEDPASGANSGANTSSPTLSAIVNATDRNIQISWVKVDNFDEYEVKIEKDDGSAIASVFREISPLGFHCDGNNCRTNLITPTENFLIASEVYSYRVQIRGVDRSAPNARYSSWSAIQEFSIAASDFVTSLTIPQILTPHHNTTQNNKTVRISWQGSNGATWYQIWINRYPGANGNSTYLNQWINIDTNNICAANLSCSLDRVLPNGSYSLWIRSWASSEVEAGGLYSDWTPKTDFVVNDLSQMSATTVGELSVSQANTYKPQFIWNGVNNADGYEFYLCHKNIDNCNSTYVFKRDIPKNEICDNNILECTLSYQKLKQTPEGWHRPFTQGNDGQNPWFSTEDGLVGSSDPHLNQYTFWVRPYQGETHGDWGGVGFTVGDQNARSVIADLKVEHNANDTVFSWHHIEYTTQYRLYVERGTPPDNTTNDLFEVGSNSPLVIQNGKASLSYEQMKSRWRSGYQDGLPSGTYIVWVRATNSTSLIDDPWSHRFAFTVP